MGKQLITGVFLHPLQIIEGENGDVMKVLRSENGITKTFGEAYFSTVKKGAFKGWKQHTRMQLNITVPVGSIKFFFLNNNFLEKETACIELSRNNYFLLTVEPGVWMGFEGMGEDVNILLNIASIPHDPDEALNEPKHAFIELFS